MKLYVSDFNGLLTDLKSRVHLADPDEADALVIWQDVAGSFKDLVQTCKKFFPKPVYVIQHGGAATRDYDFPNSNQLLADKFLCWGKNDFERLTRLGYGSRVEMVGCPLNPKIKAKVPHSEKVVLFIPVNSGKEEPENIACYYELMKIKYEFAKRRVLSLKGELSKKWGINGSINVTSNFLMQDFTPIGKLLPWHDKNLYTGGHILGYQDMPENNASLFNLLANVDCVVGMEEGTSEIYAMAHDVPVIVVDGFKYNTNGKGDIQLLRSKGATHVTLDNLQEAVSYALAHPEHLRAERKEVAEAEMGLSLGDPVQNILNIIERDHAQVSVSR